MPILTSVLGEVKEVPKRPTGKIFRQIACPITGALLYVLEEEPMKMRVVWKSKHPWEHEGVRENKFKYETFKVEAPWMYFMMRVTDKGVVTDTFMFFSPKRITEDKDPIFMPCLPNVYPSGHICNGTIRILATDPPEKKAFGLFEGFWTTPFTSETMPRDKRMLPSAFEFWGASMRSAKSLLMAWEASVLAGTPIDWKPFRYRYRRHSISMNTLAKAMEYAAVFPAREDFYF